jgi:hypothetical protein
MRPLPLSLGLWVVAALVASAQTPPGNSSGNLPQIPFGQTYKDFEFPLYQNGQLSYTLSAVSATGLTINRAQATDLKIQIYTQGKVTTTITSPNADLYVNEHKMRTNHTVRIDREDVLATAQSCDFDLTTKIYLLRHNVRVVLKHFDAGAGVKKATATRGTPQPSFPTAEMAAPALTGTPDNDTPAPGAQATPGGNLLDMPGAYANTNNGPLSPGAPASP